MMVETGVFRPDTRLELLAGEIIEMSLQKSPHAAAVSLIVEALRGGLGKGFHVRGQMPLSLDDYSEPEPDVALVKGNIRDYADHHPSTAVLVVEVADTTLAYDRLHKVTVYARNAIPEYWILNLRDRCLEVHRRPGQDTYAEHTLLTAGETASSLAHRGSGSKSRPCYPERGKIRAAKAPRTQSGSVLQTKPNHFKTSPSLPESGPGRGD